MMPSFDFSGAEVGNWLVTYAVHSTLIFAAVVLLQWKAGARLRELLWKAALVLPVLTTSARIAWPVTTMTPTWEVAEWVLPPTAAERPGVAAVTPNVASLAERPVPGSKNQPLESSTPAAPAPASPRTPWGPLQFLALGACVAAALRVAVPAFRLAKLLRGRRALDDGPLVQELEQLVRNAGIFRRIRLYALDSLSSPAAAGTLRPAIYLPTRALELSPEMARPILAHELAHHARLDPLWNRVGHIVVGVFLFQPLHRYARRRVTECAELLADDLAIRWTDDGAALATSLAEVAGWVRAQRVPALGVPMVRSRALGTLRERVERALNRPREWSATLVWPALCALTLGAMTWMPTMAGQAGRPDSGGSPAAQPMTPYEQALLRSQQALDQMEAELGTRGTTPARSIQLQRRLDTLQSQARGLVTSLNTSSHDR